MKKIRFNKVKLIQVTVMSLLMVVAFGIGVKFRSDYQVHSQEEYKDVFEETTTTTPSPSPTPVVEGAVTVNVNYKTELITISKGSKNSSKFYISTDKQKSWQLLENKKGEPKSTIDLCMFLKTSATTLYFKGDKDITPVEVEIPKEDNSLKVTYFIQNNMGTLKFENVSTSLEYRRGTNGQWKTYYQSELDLSDYEVTGYTLQFRTMASETKRAGKIINVKIPKRQNPPSVKVDYGKFVISGLKQGTTQYRLAGSTQWITFNPQDKKVKTLNLAELLLPKDTAANLYPIPAGAIEFRNLGTEKKISSGTIVVQTEAQLTPTDATKVQLVGTTLQFTDASKDKPYEYIVMHVGESPDLATAKWKKVSNAKPITIKKVDKALPVPGDIVYYRLALVKNTKTKEITPASMYSKITITSVSTTTK